MVTRGVRRSVAPGGYEGTVDAANQGGTSEEHTGLGVAIGLWEVTQILGDDDFGREEVWPVLRDVARWVCSRGVWRHIDGQAEPVFSIMRTGGPDEEASGVDDNSYTNLAAIMAMDYALLAAERFGTLGTASAEIRRWTAVRDRLALHVSSGPDSPDTLLSYDGAPSCKGDEMSAADVCNRTSYEMGAVQYLLSHGLPTRLNASTARATWALEERLRHLNRDCNVTGPPQPWCSGAVPTTPLGPGFTLPPFVSAAAFYGQRDTALTEWRKIAKHYLMPPYDLFTEYRVEKPWRMATYITTAGSVLQTVLFGLCGIRANANRSASIAGPESFTPYAATLPEGWDQISVGALTLGGEQYSMVARHGQRAVLTPLPTIVGAAFPSSRLKIDDVDVFVDPENGNDHTSVPSASRPLRTIRAALSVARAGSTVHLAKGTHRLAARDGPTIVSQPGLTFQGDGAEISGGYRIEGPWQNHSSVWEAALPPTFDAECAAGSRLDQLFAAGQMLEPISTPVMQWESFLTGAPRNGEPTGAVIGLQYQEPNPVDVVASNVYIDPPSVAGNYARVVGPVRTAVVFGSVPLALAVAPGTSVSARLANGTTLGPWTLASCNEETIVCPFRGPSGHPPQGVMSLATTVRPPTEQLKSVELLVKTVPGGSYRSTCGHCAVRSDGRLGCNCTRRDGAAVLTLSNESDCMSYVNEDGALLCTTPSQSTWSYNRSLVSVWHQWTVSLHEVRTHFPENRTLLFTAPGEPNSGRLFPAGNRRYTVARVPELELLPGQFERRGNRLRLRPLPAWGSAPPRDVYVPCMQTLLRVNATETTFRDVSFRHSRWSCPEAPHPCDGSSPGEMKLSAMVEVTGVHGVSFMGCTFDQVGSTGLMLRSADGAVVASSNFSMMGAGAIDAGQSHSASVSDSTIRDGGRVFRFMPGIFGASTPNLTVAHNEFTGLVSNAVDLGGDNAGTRLSHNWIHDNGRADNQGISDFGAIHGAVAGDADNPVILEGNVISRIRSFSWGGNGIYLDCSSHGVAVIGNLVHDVGGAALQLNEDDPNCKLGPKPAGNTFRGNVFVGNGFSSKDTPSVLNYNGMKVHKQFSRNVFAVLSTSRGENGSATTPLYRGQPDSLNHSVLSFASNLYWAAPGQELVFPLVHPPTFAGWQAAGWDETSIEADPMFVDAPRDFRFAPGSPALALGIASIDRAAAGPRRTKSDDCRAPYPYWYGSKTAGIYCCANVTFNNHSDCPTKYCCLTPGTISGCQSVPRCPAAPPPVVTTLSATSFAVEGGGAPLLVRGSGFSNRSVFCRIDPAHSPTQFSFDTGVTINCTVVSDKLARCNLTDAEWPALAPGPGLLKMSNDGSEWSNAVAVNYDYLFDVALDRRPYVSEANGHVLLRCNASLVGQGGVTVLASLPSLSASLGRWEVTLNGSNVLAFPLGHLPATVNTDVKIVVATTSPTAKSVVKWRRFMRAPTPAAGGAVAVQVDHSRRSLLVGGEPFFGTGWYSGTGNGTGDSAFTPDSGTGHWSESIYTRIEMQARLGDNMMMP